MRRRVTLVRTDVWEELIASIIGVTKIGELGKTLAVKPKHAVKKYYAAYYNVLLRSCERGNEPLGSIKYWESTECLHNLWPLKWYSAPQS
jgi:hypothetical protein